MAPEQQIVIAATSAFENMTKLQRLLDLIYDYIIDRLDQGGVKRISIHSEDTLMLQQPVGCYGLSCSCLQAYTGKYTESG